MGCVLRHAIKYAAHGWHVLPLIRGQKRPDTELARRGYLDATADPKQAWEWWQKRPDAGIGISCRASGLVAIDVDPRHGGDDALHDLERKLGPLPSTVSAQSGGGGWHHLYRHPGHGLVGELAPGVDIKDRGYVVAPPSLHPSGRRYEWSVDGHPEDVTVAELPERWREAMRAREREHVPAAADSADPMLRVPASRYLEVLAARKANGQGWAQCPLHRGGKERTPSLKVDGRLWACHACKPIAGKQVMGGNIYDLAALLWDFPIPLTGADFMEVRSRLWRLKSESRKSKG